MNNTFIFLKPDAIERGLVGKILARFEEKGFSITYVTQKIATVELLEQHYAEHREKPFFRKLVESIANKNIICVTLSGPTADTVQLVRQMIGEASPLKRTPGTIRGDYACEQTNNLIHSSDSTDAVIRESGIWLS